MKSANNLVCKYASIMLFLNVTGLEHTDQWFWGFRHTGPHHSYLRDLIPAFISFAL